MDGVGEACAFASHEEDVGWLEREVVKAFGGFGGQGDNTGCCLGYLCCCRLVKGVPAGVFCPVEVVDIVHAGAADFVDVPDKAARLDDVEANVEAGAQAHHGSSVLRNVGFKEGEAHDFSVGLLARSGDHGIPYCGW